MRKSLVTRSARSLTKQQLLPLPHTCKRVRQTFHILVAHCKRHLFTLHFERASHSSLPSYSRTTNDSPVSTKHSPNTFAEYFYISSRKMQQGVERNASPRRRWSDGASLGTRRKLRRSKRLQQAPATADYPCEHRFSSDGRPSESKATHSPAPTA